MTGEQTRATHPLIAFIAQWWQQIAITQAGIYLVASFGSAHAILPWAAAWALAIGMEGTYLRGLVDAGHVRGEGQRWAAALIYGTYGTIVVWGIAYILGLPAVGVIPAGDLGPWWGVPLALIHVGPISYTGLCAAMLHRARTTEAAQRRAELERRAQLRDERVQAQLDQEAAAARAERERIDREVYEAEQKALARARVRAAHLPAHPAPDAAPAPLPSAAARRVRRADRAELVRVVRAAHDADPSFNRAAVARETGYSEAMIRKVLKDIQEG